jgi:beta-fructofuranosidase
MWKLLSHFQAWIRQRLMLQVAQDLCSQKGSKVQGGVGPFGLLTLASENLAEFTRVFFRIFKAPNKHVVILCSDATRYE